MLAESVASEAAAARLEGLRARLRDMSAMPVWHDSMEAVQPARDAEPPPWSTLKQMRSIIKLWDLFEQRYPEKSAEEAALNAEVGEAHVPAIGRSV